VRQEKHRNGNNNAYDHELFARARNALLWGAVVVIVIVAGTADVPGVTC
jgi:hypothetical protein